MLRRGHRRASLRTALSLVLLMLPALIGAQSGSSRVAGKVVDARTGQPLGHALVSLIDLRTEQPAATVYTSADGSYAFPSTVPNGKYRLVGEAVGHIASAYLAHGQFSTAIVTGAGLPTNALLLSLQPEAAVFGRVMDENGDPAKDARLALYRLSADSGVMEARAERVAQVGDDGSFRLDRLQPGNYFLTADGRPWYAVHPPLEPPGMREPYRTSIDAALNVAYPTVFAPLGSNEGGSPLTVTAGEQVQVNLQFTPEPAVTLTLDVPADSRSGRPPQLTQRVFGQQIPVQAQVQAMPGKEQIVGVAPGQYTLHTYGDGGQLPANVGEVDLRNGSVARDAMTHPRLAQVRVEVVRTAATPVGEKLYLNLESAERNSDDSRATVEVSAEGFAIFDGVPPGEYNLRLAGSGKVMEGTVQGDPEAVRDGHLLVTSAEPVRVTFAAQAPGVVVEGLVQHGKTPLPAAMVLLIPARRTIRPELIRRDQSDLDGSFSLPNVFPGDYLLLALTDAWSLNWADLHVLSPYLQHAQPVHIAATGETTVHLKSAVDAQPVR